MQINPPVRMPDLDASRYVETRRRMTKVYLEVDALRDALEHLNLVKKVDPELPFLIEIKGGKLDLIELAKQIDNFRRVSVLGRIIDRSGPLSGIQHCAECGNPIDVGGRRGFSKRIDTHYCKDACRKAASRRRKKQATQTPN